LVALFVGGDWERKGLSCLLDAVAAAPEWHVIVVGSGDIEHYGQRAERVATGRAHFVGRQRETYHYYSAADVFAFPTAYEAFPMSLLEAASSGLPLLVTPVSGAVDLVRDGENGWFITRNPAVVAERLRRLASDRAAMQRMGASARRTTRELTWEQVADAYARLYAEVASA
jgi:UDP-glucose:(heptosyl)LPS alpha-1,3-glucosyltransferase